MHLLRKNRSRTLALTLILGVLLCGSASAAEPADNVTVMSFNILRQSWAKPGAAAWAERKADVIKTIEDKSPDFVGTQEEAGGQMEDILAALPAYREVPGRQISGGILYLHRKWDLLKHGLTRFEGDAQMRSHNRYFIWGLFAEKETKRAIYVYSTHLPHDKQATLSDRVAGMELMARHVAQRQVKTVPVILTGDFNSKVDLETMRTLTGETGNLPIQFIYAMRDVKKRGFSYGIDHILVLPGTNVVESGVAAGIWDSGSDHPAVFAVIEPWFGDLIGYPRL